MTITEDINARVGKRKQDWNELIEKHREKTMNKSRRMLLEIC